MSIAPLDLHFKMLPINHVQRTEHPMGNWAVKEAGWSIDRRAQRHFRTVGCNISTRHIDESRTRARSMQQRSCLPALGGSRTDGSRTATKKELEETWKARCEYQQQTCAVVNDSQLSVAVRTIWARGLRTKENLTRAESTVATLLRTGHFGLND